MHIYLTSKRAIVSGSTVGNELGIARGSAAARAHVVINGQTDAPVEQASADVARTVW